MDGFDCECMHQNENLAMSGANECPWKSHETVKSASWSILSEGNPLCPAVAPPWKAVYTSCGFMASEGDPRLGSTRQDH